MQAFALHFLSKSKYFRLEKNDKSFSVELEIELIPLKNTSFSKFESKSIERDSNFFLFQNN